MEYKITLTDAELSVVLTGLGKLTGAEMFSTACKIIGQVDAQKKTSELKSNAEEKTTELPINEST